MTVPADKLLLAAQRLTVQGDGRAARRVLDELIAADPLQLKARAHRAWLRYLAADFAGAAADAEAILTRYPSDPMALALAGDAHFRAGHPGRGRDRIVAAIEADPANAFAVAVLARHAASHPAAAESSYLAWADTLARRAGVEDFRTLDRFAHLAATLALTVQPAAILLAADSAEESLLAALGAAATQAGAPLHWVGWGATGTEDAGATPIPIELAAVVHGIPWQGIDAFEQHLRTFDGPALVIGRESTLPDTPALVVQSTLRAAPAGSLLVLQGTTGGISGATGFADTVALRPPSAADGVWLWRVGLSKPDAPPAPATAFLQRIKKALGY